MSIIEIKNAGFSYDQRSRRVFEGLSLNIEKGKLYCLMGPNGCGKSTLLDCILGAMPLNEGEIIIDGKNVEHYNPRLLAQKIAYVPQGHQSTFPYTVEQVVLMGRTAHARLMAGPGKGEIDIVMRVLKQIGIEGLASRPYTQISGGEMQLVMLARALVQETPIIIMDEPTAHLDFSNELVFLETVVRLVRKSGITIILATHSPNQPFYFESQNADVLAVAMTAGGKCLSGRPSELLTEDMMMNVYGIKAKLLRYEDNESGIITRIVPLKTVEADRR